MKKLLTLLVVIALIVSIVLTAGQLGGALASLEFPRFDDFFAKEETYCTLSLQTGAGGRVDGAQSEYKKGDTVTLVAAPDEGFVFSGWFANQTTYLATAKTYSFVIERDTVLYANFAVKPEKMEGQTASYEELFGCDTDLAFTVYCDRTDAKDYLMNNLKVVDSDLLGTQWEEQGQIPFTVSAGQEKNAYQISPAEGTAYVPGTTYTAVLADGGSFLKPENDQRTLNFTIREADKEQITYRDGIAYLSEEVLEVVDLGDDIGASEDYPQGYVLLRGQVSMTAGTVFCVYSGKQANGQPQLDENSFFGKVVGSQADGGNTRIQYRLPELGEVYDDLDVLYSGGVNLAASGAIVSTKLGKQVRSGLLSNASFQNYVAAAQQAVVNQYGSQYHVPLLSQENLAQRIQTQVVPVLDGNKATVDIQVTLNIPIQAQGSGQTVAQFAFQMNIHKQIELSTYFKLQERQLADVPVDIASYDFHVGMVDTETFTLDVSFRNDGSADFAAWEEDFSREFEKLLGGDGPMFQSIRKLFAENGYDSVVQTRMDLFHLDHTVGMATFGLDVDMALELELTANLHYTAESVKSMTVGIRSGANGPVTYKSFSSQAAADELILAGNAKIDAKVCMDAEIRVAGMAKQLDVDMDFETGICHTLGGCVNLNSAVYAGFAEAEGSWQAHVDYLLLSAKGSQTLEGSGAKSPVFAYGSKQAVVGYEKQEAIDNSKTNTIAIMDKTADLFGYELLKISVLNAADGKLSAEALDPTAYAVSVQTQKYLTCDAVTGKLLVAEDAPGFFQEQIVITVKAKDAGWKKLEEGSASCFLPAITVTVVYGDEDAYLASSDSDMEKEFRVLYREYNANNAAFLQENFKQILGKIQVPEEFAGLMDGLINSYLDNLFTTIEDYRKLETPGLRDMENKFVRTETGPFELTMEVFGKVTDKSQFNKEEVVGWVDQLLVSEAMYRTILEFGDSDACKVLAEKFANVNQQTKDTVSAALSEFETTHMGNSHAMDIVAAVRKILGL